MAHATQERGYRFQCPTMKLDAKPNVYRRSLEARNNTDAFLLAAAGVDHDAEERQAKRNRAYKQAALILAAVGLIVAGWVF